MNPIVLLLFSALILFVGCDIQQKTENPISSVNQETLVAQIDSLNTLSWEYSPNNFYKSVQTAKQALALSKINKIYHGEATALCRIGLAYDYKGSYDTALIFYHQSADLWQLNNDNKGLAMTYNNIGTSFYCRTMYVEAVDYYLKSLKLREEVSDTSGIAQSLNNIGLSYRVQNNFNKAIECYKRSIDIRKQINDSVGIMYAEQNLGAAFDRIEEYDSALNHYSKAIALARILNDSLSLASNLSNSSNINKKIGSLNKALKQIKSSEHILRKLGNDHTLAYCLYTFGEVYFANKEFLKAEKYTYESLEIAKKLSRNELVQQDYQLLAHISDKLNNHSLAYKYHVMYNNLKDSILNKTTTQQLSELQTKYETQKKEQQIQLLTQEKVITSKQRTIAFTLAGILLLLIVIIILIYNRKRLKNREQTSSLKQKMLRSQMNPHFIFNALGSIQSFIFYNKSNDATHYLAKFSTLMRDILEGSVNEFVPIKQDMTIAENYLSLEHLRHKNKFNYKVNHIGDIDNLQIPPMLTQPFIENSIKHGFKDIDDGLIEVVYKIDDQYIIIEIADNGIGFKNGNVNKKHKSYAVEITKQRLKLAGKGNKLELISPTANNKGTKAIITLVKQICKNEFYE